MKKYYDTAKVELLLIKTKDIITLSPGGEGALPELDYGNMTNT